MIPLWTIIVSLIGRVCVCVSAPQDDKLILDAPPKQPNPRPRRHRRDTSNDPLDLVVRARTHTHTRTLAAELFHLLVELMQVCALQLACTVLSHIKTLAVAQFGAC